jgi:hypothetical protein
MDYNIVSHTGYNYTFWAKNDKSAKLIFYHYLKNNVAKKFRKKYFLEDVNFLTVKIGR